MVNKFFFKLIILLFILIPGIKILYLSEMVPRFGGITGVLFVAVFGWIITYKDEFVSNADKAINKTLESIKPLYRLISLILISLIIRVIFILIFQIDSISAHPDINVYVTTARELSQTGIARTYAAYCHTFSHMFWFACFLVPVVKAFGSSPAVLSVYLSIIDTVTVILLFQTLKNKIGNVGAFRIMLFYSLLPSNLLLPQYITHEHALLLFTALFMWLYFCVLERTKVLVAKLVVLIFMSISIFLAIQMNTAGLVSLIALSMTVLIGGKEPYEKRQLRTGFAVITIMLSIALAGTPFFSSFQNSHSELSPRHIDGEKVLWTLYVGSNTETLGKWSEADVISYDAVKPGSSAEEYHEHRVGMVKQRYSYLLNNPNQLFKLIRGKLVTVWGAFTYTIQFTNETISDPHLQHFYNLILSKLFLLIETSMSLAAAVFGLIINCRKIKDKCDEFYMFCGLYMLGFTAMLLLTECSNKYTIALQPVFWIACLYHFQGKQSSAETNELSCEGHTL